MEDTIKQYLKENLRFSGAVKADRNNYLIGLTIRLHLKEDLLDEITLDLNRVYLGDEFLREDLLKALQK
jgi:hypothetical protein